MKKIWTDDIVEFKGKYYNIPVSKVEPKPIQKPHIPINWEALREMYPTRQEGCFIRKPVTTDYLLKRIRSELD